MKFFIKSLNNKSKMTQPERVSGLSEESARLVAGGTGGGDGSQPRARNLSPESALLFVGG
jgi:hypothetical protein